MCSSDVASPVSLMASALDALTVEQPTDLPAMAVRGQLVELLAAMNRLHAQVARRVAVFEANGTCIVDAARSAKAWLRAAGRLSPQAATRLVAAGRVLTDLPVLAEAAVEGDVSSEHIERVARLAERVSPAVLATVDEPLTELARQVDPRTLEHACARVREHADPDGPRPDPRVDFERRGITTSEFDGMLLVRGQLDPEGGAALQAALDALMRPPAPGDQRRATQRRADALVQLARGALAAGRLPEVGGVKPQIGILLRPEHLTGEPGGDGPAAAVAVTGERSGEGPGERPGGRPAERPGAHAAPGDPPRLGSGPAAADPLTVAGIRPARPRAWLGWIGDVSDQTAQRIACDAEVWRIILDPATSRPLELGRSHRLVPGWLRKALHARDRGCRFPGCDAPTEWTDGHHLAHWSQGGRTDIDNLLSLCRHHHVLVHEAGWSIMLDGSTGVVTVRRPNGEVYAPPRHRLGLRRRPPAGSGGEAAA